VHTILGEGSFGVKIEADSNDITEYPAHYDQSSIGMILVLYSLQLFASHEY